MFYPKLEEHIVTWQESGIANGGTEPPNLMALLGWLDASTHNPWVVIFWGDVAVGWVYGHSHTAKCSRWLWYVPDLAQHTTLRLRRGWLFVAVQTGIYQLFIG